MSEQRHPVVMCDGDDGECGVVALDHTLGGLGRLVGSETQLPPGWSGDKPGSRDGDKHYCPYCTASARVHNHSPRRPECPERAIDGGQLRGACLNDDGSDRD